MPRLADRIRALETRLAGSGRRHQEQLAAAAMFSDRILRIAERYPDEAEFTSEAVRQESFSPAQRLAWTLRFERSPERIEAALSEAASMVAA